jgi:hypothetical protein
MAIMALLFALWSITLIAPDTPIGRFLHRLLVEGPAAWLSRIKRGHVLLALALAGITGVAMWLMGGDGLVALGMAAPEISSWIAMFEVTTWIDVVVAIALASSAIRVRMVATQIRARLSRWTVRSGARTVRARKKRRPVRPAPSNDDDARPRERWAA